MPISTYTLYKYLAWAPMSAFLLQQLFGSNILTTVDFFKEALPFTDIIPIAVLAWFLKYVWPDSPLSNTLGIGSSNNNNKKK